MFGTDGVRGTPGHDPLDADTVVGLGAAVAAELGDSPRVVCGRDTRDSGVWLERQFAAGVHSEGGTFVSVEQVRGLPINSATDIWALGAIGFEMLTGRRLVAGADPRSVVDRRESGF